MGGGGKAFLEKVPDGHPVVGDLALILGHPSVSYALRQALIAGLHEVVSKEKLPKTSKTLPVRPLSSLSRQTKRFSRELGLGMCFCASLFWAPALSFNE